MLANFWRSIGSGESGWLKVGELTCCRQSVNWVSGKEVLQLNHTQHDTNWNKKRLLDAGLSLYFQVTQTTAHTIVRLACCDRMTEPRTRSSRPGPRTNLQGQDQGLNTQGQDQGLKVQGQGQDQGLKFCPQGQPRTKAKDNIPARQLRSCSPLIEMCLETDVETETMARTCTSTAVQQPVCSVRTRIGDFHHVTAPYKLLFCYYYYYYFIKGCASQWQYLPARLLAPRIGLFHKSATGIKYIYIKSYLQLNLHINENMCKIQILERVVQFSV